jgi:hypothetical protein
MKTSVQTSESSKVLNFSCAVVGDSSSSKLECSFFIPSSLRFYLCIFCKRWWCIGELRGNEQAVYVVYQW